MNNERIQELAKPYQWNDGRMEGWTFNMPSELQAFAAAILAERVSMEPVAYWDGDYKRLSWANSDPNCDNPLYSAEQVAQALRERKELYMAIWLGFFLLSFCSW